MISLKNNIPKYMIIPLVIILYGVSLITFYTNVNNGLMLAIYIAIYILMVSIQDYKPARRSFKERLKKVLLFIISLVIWTLILTLFDPLYMDTKIDSVIFCFNNLIPLDLCDFELKI